MLAGGAGAGAAWALGQGGGGGTGSSVADGGTGTVGTGRIVTAPSTSPSGLPRGTAAEQTHPSVLPRTGGRRTHFVVRLTLADPPGHSGVLATGYRLVLTVPAKRSAARCSPAGPASIDAGIAHQVVRVPLATPAGGWCRGRHGLTVFLQRGPYCPTPAPGSPPPPCPEFAEQDLEVGSAHFTVGP